MYGHKRARVELDADTHECFRYFSLLRGVPVGSALRRVLALHAETIESEYPPIHAHMLAWRAAQAAKQAGADARLRWDDPLMKAGATVVAQQGVSLDDTPF